MERAGAAGRSSTGFLTSIPKPPSAVLIPLHLDDGHGWRGGQQQVALLAAVDPLLCPAGSPLSQVHPSPYGWGPIELHRAIRTERPDLVAAHSSGAHDLALLQWRAPVIVHRRVDFRRSSLKYRAVQGFVAVSRAVRDVLVEGGVDRRRIEVVNDALPPMRPGIPLPRPEGLLVLCAGASVPHKDHATAARAVAQLGGTLWIAGAGRGETNAVSLGYRFDLPDLLATADVFCHPSVEEGYGSVLLQARAAGIPIVCTRAGGAPEAAGPHAILVAPRDPDGMALAITRAARLERRPERLLDHTPAAIREQTLEAYRTLRAV